MIWGVTPPAIAALRVIFRGVQEVRMKTPATPDFVHFKFSTLNGPAVQNKGMALFPRRVNGQFAMLSRQDDENILLMLSPNIHFWADRKSCSRPRSRGSCSSRAMRLAD